jgi:hypothetical protein
MEYRHALTRDDSRVDTRRRQRRVAAAAVRADTLRRYYLSEVA